MIEGGKAERPALKALGGAAVLVALLAAGHGLAQTQPAASSVSASASASASSSASSPAPEPPGCPGMVIDHARDDTLTFYNELLDPVATATNKKAPHSLHIPIADCDAYYDYVELEPLVKANIAVPTKIYVGGRAAIKVGDVAAVSLASLVPPLPAAKPSPAKGAKKTTSTPKSPPSK